MDLARFKLEGLLGEGADLQVFSATDIATGDAVVLKRPHPTLVQRGQHGDVERSLLRAKALRDRPRSALPHLAQMIGHGRQSTGDTYFGDTLEIGYMVAVERRARGLPLMGSASDAVKGMPIGLPQNLFVRHPAVPRRSGGPFTIATDLLDTAEAFLRGGHLLLDLGCLLFSPRQANLWWAVWRLSSPRDQDRDIGKGHELARHSSHYGLWRQRIDCRHRYHVPRSSPNKAQDRVRGSAMS